MSYLWGWSPLTRFQTLKELNKKKKLTEVQNDKRIGMHMF